ncbi:hypothetical protein [Aliivibrio fischeri]|uniref:hypothetical protein n=1 Tax=Aliivibrio fischeri TaxID=668 RepID=UPI0007C5CE2E|nr:hypothetical protein [Aliivibrio fischeri]
MSMQKTLSKEDMFTIGYSTILESEIDVVIDFVNVNNNGTFYSYEGKKIQAYDIEQLKLWAKENSLLIYPTGEGYDYDFHDLQSEHAYNTEVEAIIAAKAQYEHVFKHQLEEMNESINNGLWLLNEHNQLFIINDELSDIIGPCEETCDGLIHLCNCYSKQIDNSSNNARSTSWKNIPTSIIEDEGFSIVDNLLRRASINDGDIQYFTA